jgi:hypothetical protein
MVLLQRDDGPWGVDVKGSRYWYAHRGSADQSKHGKKSQNNASAAAAMGTQAVTCVLYVPPDALSVTVLCPHGMLATAGAYGEVRFWRIDYNLAGNGAWEEVKELAFDVRDFAAELLPRYCVCCMYACLHVRVRVFECI